MSMKRKYTRLFFALVSFVLILSVSSFSQEVTELKTDGSDDGQDEQDDDAARAVAHRLRISGRRGLLLRYPEMQNRRG